MRPWTKRQTPSYRLYYGIPHVKACEARLQATYSAKFPKPRSDPQGRSPTFRPPCCADYHCQRKVRRATGQVFGGRAFNQFPLPKNSKDVWESPCLVTGCLHGPHGDTKPKQDQLDAQNWGQAGQGPCNCRKDFLDLALCSSWKRLAHKNEGFTASHTST